MREVKLLARDGDADRIGRAIMEIEDDLAIGYVEVVWQTGIPGIPTRGWAKVSHQVRRKDGAVATRPGVSQFTLTEDDVRRFTDGLVDPGRGRAT